MDVSNLSITPSLMDRHLSHKQNLLFYGPLCTYSCYFGIELVVVRIVE